MRIDDWAQSEIDRRFAQFAEKHICNRAAALRQVSLIPTDLWSGMQAAGLFGLGLPEPFGGRGYDMPTLLSAGRALVESGGNLGVAMSWLVHEMTARLILSFGRPEHHRTWLPELAAGRRTACLAVSEPEAGAHPKLLKTLAEKDGDHYVLTGTKTYLTNGPVADLFIVIAITGIEDGRKRFSAFLVPRDTPGLAIGEPLAFDFLRPAPHGGISLAGCRVAEQQMLGPAGDAWEPMVLGFREAEDTMMAGLLIGGLAFGLSRLRDMEGLTDSVKEEIFDAHVDLCGLWAIAKKAARMLEKGENPAERYDLALYFRTHAGEVLKTIGHIATQAGIEPLSDTAAMLADISAALRIGGSALSARKRKRRTQWFERN